MYTKTISILTLLFTLLMITVSCEETEEPVVNPYENWQERNAAFMDSLVRVSQQPESDLERLESLSYPNQYIYVKKWTRSWRDLK